MAGMVLWINLRATLRSEKLVTQLWLQMAVLVGEFTTHFRTYFSRWIGMFTGGTGF